MPNRGESTFSIYFGTKYDNINVPYDTSDIEEFATKVLTRPGQYVWQTTWIVSVQVNIDDYQDIVGAQYVKMTDDGTDNHGSHWFTVAGYMMLSPRTVLLSLIYDPLLTIGIQWIENCTGFMQRWSVRDDSPNSYVSTSEPWNNIDDMLHEYNNYNCLSTSTAAINTPIVGFPYDLRSPPEIVEYDGPSVMPYILPRLKSLTPEIITTFISSLGNDTRGFNDGFLYNLWTHDQQPQVRNFEAAIGMHMDIATQAYKLPLSPLINYLSDVGDNGELFEIKGLTTIWSPGLSLKNQGTYNNQKTRDMGVFVTLYNDVSGDAIQVSGQDLNTLSVKIMCNPYITGAFYARLTDFMHDTNGLSGLVASPGWSGFQLTSAGGFGASLNNLNTATQLDASALLARQAGDTADYQIRTAERAYEIADMGGIAGILDTASGAAGLLSLNPNGLAGAIQGQQQRDFERESTIELANLTRAQAEQQAVQQRRQLTVNGNIGRAAPPLSKTQKGNAQIEPAAYSFSVRVTRPGLRTRSNLDTKFTAFGYNVDGTLITGKADLRTRTRFTFIMADEFQILSINPSLNADLTRVRDPMSVAEIKRRFAGGLRIWNRNVNPDYDYFTPNTTI